jgi:hypothetical protein
MTLGNRTICLIYIIWPYDCYWSSENETEFWDLFWDFINLIYGGVSWSHDGIERDEVPLKVNCFFIFS